MYSVYIYVHLFVSFTGQQLKKHLVSQLTSAGDQHTVMCRDDAGIICTVCKDFYVHLVYFSSTTM